MRFALIIAGALALAACDGAGSVTGDQTSTLAESPANNPAGESGVFGSLVYGDPDAKVTIVEYGSLTCGACAAFSQSIMPEIKEKYIDTGIAKLVYRDYLRNNIDLAAGIIARCKTDDFAKKMHDMLFRTQQEWLGSQDQVAGLASVARKLGMSRVEFDRCMTNKDLQQHLADITEHGRLQLKIEGTPTIFINGRELGTGTMGELKENLATMIEEAAK